ncbi:MAG: hypothetical protein RIR86_930 [Acidobacteriota bacterium]|jgi:protein SCO1/2
MNNIFTRISRLLIIILALPLLACRQEAPPTASPNASRYDLRGKVVSFDKARREVTIAHEAIPGYMEAMTMPFTLNEEWVFDVLTPGAQIQATLVVDGAKSWIETPTVTQMADTPESAGATPGPEPEPGVELPDFTLVNQDGEKISLQQFRGQHLVLTFIYTRCPLPDYCPLMTRNFGEIGQSILRESRKTRLLSVTIDPDYDTPPVLKDYGKRYLPEGLSFRQWSYGTGSDEEIRKITGFFGLSYWQENNQIIHGLRTVVISPQGRIVRIFRGNDWRPEEIVALLGEQR